MSNVSRQTEKKNVKSNNVRTISTRGMTRESNNQMIEASHLIGSVWKHQLCFVCLNETEKFSISLVCLCTWILNIDEKVSQVQPQMTSHQGQPRVSWFRVSIYKHR